MTSNNITILKSIIKNKRISIHDHIFMKICEDRIKILNTFYIFFQREKANIRELSKNSEIKNICTDFVLKKKEIY